MCLPRRPPQLNRGEAGRPRIANDGAQQAKEPKTTDTAQHERAGEGEGRVRVRHRTEQAYVVQARGYQWCRGDARALERVSNKARSPAPLAARGDGLAWRLALDPGKAGSADLADACGNPQ